MALGATFLPFFALIEEGVQMDRVMRLQTKSYACFERTSPLRRAYVLHTHGLPP